MSEEISSPVVVDSPLPSTPLDSAPVESQDTAPPDPNAWKSELTQSYGIDVTGFSNRDDALTAVRAIADQYAREGLAVRDPEVTPPPASAAEPDALKGINFKELDPKVAKALQALQEQTKKAQEDAAQARQIIQQQEQKQFSQQQQEISSRAMKHLESIAAEKYGTSTARTAAQTIELQNLFRTTGALVRGMRANNQPVPTVEKVIELGILLTGGKLPSQGTQSQVSSTANQSIENFYNGLFTPPAEEQRGPAPSKYKDPRDPLGIKNDPSFRAGVRQILARSK